MEILKTYDEKGREYLFEYKYGYKSFNGREKIEFQVNFLNDEEKQNWFDFKLAPIDEETLKVTDIFKGKDSHLKTGLPEALILLSKQLFNKKIISSSNKVKTESCEWRSEPGTKVWKRLVKRNLALYDSETDTFTLK